MKKQKAKWKELNLQCCKKAYMNCKTAPLTEALPLQDSTPLHHGHQQRKMLKLMLNFKPSADPSSYGLSVWQSAIPTQLTTAKYKHNIHMLKISCAQVLQGSVPYPISSFN